MEDVSPQQHEEVSPQRHEDVSPQQHEEVSPQQHEDASPHQSPPKLHRFAETPSVEVGSQNKVKVQSTSTQVGPSIHDFTKDITNKTIRGLKTKVRKLRAARLSLK